MRILIIEDEPLAVERLVRLIQEQDSDCEIISGIDSVVGALEWLSENAEPDITFLDIELADGRSFEILEVYKFTNPIIFTTAFDEFAVQAFRVQALDYLLKPIKKLEFGDALSRAIAHLRSKVSQSDALEQLKTQNIDKSLEFRKRLMVRFGQSFKVVESEDIAYLYTEEKVVLLVTFAGRTLPLDYTLEQLERMLDPAIFFRINRQFIVNMHAVQDMTISSKSRVKLGLHPKTSKEVIVSTERSPVFKKWISGEHLA